jgi:hypothetical protein
MTKPNYTDITILLDRSESMAQCWSAAIEGLNGYINCQRQLPGECTVSLFLFDDRYETAFVGVPIHDVEHIPQHKYPPRGCTALIGALGKTIDELGSRLSAMKPEERPSQVLLITITDGKENCSHIASWSRMYDKHAVRQRVEHQKNKYSWQFVFMGANQDSFLTSTELGIDATSAINFNNTPKGVDDAWKSISCSTGMYRLRGVSRLADFFGGQKHASDPVANQPQLGGIIPEVQKILDEQKAKADKPPAKPFKPLA